MEFPEPIQATRGIGELAENPFPADFPAAAFCGYYLGLYKQAICQNVYNSIAF
jgi:hypothetical protein